MKENFTLKEIIGFVDKYSRVIIGVLLALLVFSCVSCNPTPPRSNTQKPLSPRQHMFGNLEAKKTVRRSPRISICFGDKCSVVKKPQQKGITLRDLLKKMNKKGIEKI